jgi:FkbM family methyltransferase
MIGFIRKLVSTLRSVATHPLNKDRGWRAAMEFCLIQAAARLVPGDVCVRFPEATRLLISPHMKGAAHFIAPGLCEFNEMCFVTHFLRPGDTFADVGANVGAFTLLASGVAGADTVAFEPSPSTFLYLLANIRLNDLTQKARATNAAVGAIEGKLRLSADLGTENYVCPKNETISGIEVSMTTLDKAFQRSAPTLMKIDVEGFETEVIAGATRTLADPTLQAMILERGALGNRYGFDEDSLHQGIRELGFRPCAYSALDRALSSLPPDAHGNIIYVRNFDSAQERLRTAPKFRFAGFEI